MHSSFASIALFLGLSLILTSTLVACGDDGDGGSGGGSSDGGGDGDGDGNGDGDGDGDGTGSSGGVDTCVELCNQAPIATQAQGECVYAFMAEAGYGIVTADSCQGVVDTAGCTACYAEITPNDGDCGAAHVECF